MMVGRQEGTLTDFGISFRQAVLSPRIVVFLLIGLVIFAMVTFWPRVVPYLTRPGISPLGVGLLVVLGGQTVMNWYDPLASSNGDGKFSAVRTAATASPNLSSVAVAFFSWLAWTLAVVALAGCAAAIVTRLRVFGYLTAVVGLAGAVLAYIAHTDVVNLGGGIDHSLGMYADIIGFVILAGAGVTGGPRAFGCCGPPWVREVRDELPARPAVRRGRRGPRTAGVLDERMVRRAPDQRHVGRLAS